VVLLRADSITLGFEDLTDGTRVTTQYAGLTFSNTAVLTAGISLDPDFPPESGENVVFDDGGPISIFSDTPIWSFSGYFTHNVVLTLTAFDGLGDSLGSATSVFSDNLACVDARPCESNPGSSPNEFIQLNFDEPFASLTIVGAPNGHSFTMDDVTIETAPEPNTLFLMLPLILLMSEYSRHRSRRDQSVGKGRISVRSCKTGHG
jgi:hypothetical protein